MRVGLKIEIKTTIMIRKSGQLCMAFTRAQTEKSFRIKQRTKRWVPKIILCTPISSLSKSLEIYIMYSNRSALR